MLQILDLRKLLLFLLISFCFSPFLNSREANAEAKFSLEMLSSTKETLEMRLVKHEPTEEGKLTLEFFLSDGLQFVAIDTFVGSIEPTVDIMGADLIRYSFELNELASQQVDLVLGTVKFNRTGNNAQTIELRDLSDDKTYVSTYYQIDPIREPFSGDVIEGISFTTFLKWCAIVLTCTLVVLFYFVYTTYKKETNSQQFVLFGLVAAASLVVVIMVLALNRYQDDPEAEVLGVLELNTIERVRFPEEDTFGESCGIEEYPKFLSDYIKFDREGVLESRSDLSGDGDIDNVDLDLFIECMRSE